MDIPGYQIEHEIGRGGMATVYAAIQIALERRVALKVIHHQFNDDADFTQRFIREGRIGAKLHHPHIVTIFEYGTYSNCHYLSMEYFPGGTLGSRIRQGLTLGQTLAIVTTIADALAYAHNLRLIHRDVKPSNILFRRDESPVLTDFGIARLENDSERITATGKTLGTVHYMSPEQIRGEQLDNRADLYSLGVVFYQMLIGRLPYDGDNYFDISKQHVFAGIPRLPGTLSRFQPVLERLLAKNRHERFSSAEQFIEALTAVANARTPQRSYAPPRPSRPSKRSRSSRTVILTGVGVLVVAVGATAVLAPHWFARQNLQEAELLLNQAQRSYAAEQLDDTLSTVENGLALAPAHPQLLALRDRVQTKLNAQKQAERYLNEAQQFYDSSRIEDSLAAVDQGLALVSNHPRLLDLRRRLEDELNKRQEAATQQRILQADQIFTKASQYYHDDRLQDSLALVDNGLELIADHPGLLELRSTLQERIQEQQTESADISGREQQIQSFLDKAEQQLAQNRLTFPPGDNAFESYQMILTLDPYHPAVQQGYDKIATAYLALAKEVFATDPDQSLEHIDKGLQVAPHHRGLLALKEKVRAAQATESILRQAQASFEKGRLFEPAEDNAFERYLQVLNRDPDNVAAREGLIQLFKQYFEQLDKQILSREQQKTELDDIMALVEKALSVVPAYDRLLTLRSDIEAQQAEIGPILRSIGELMITAKAQAQAGNMQEPPGDNACDSYRQVLQLDPNHTGAKELLSAANCSVSNSEVARLLAIAERQLRQKKLTTPKGDNAFETYQAILELDPYHPQVEAGFAKIAERYQQLAEQNRRSPDNRWDLIRKGLQVAPEHAGLLALREQIKPQIIKRLINRGRSNLREFYWNTAIESFRQVLELDPENSEGQRGLVNIANALVRFPGDYDGAYLQYRHVLELNPANRDAAQGLLRVRRYYANRLERDPDNETIREKLDAIDALLEPAPATAANEP